MRFVIETAHYTCVTNQQVSTYSSSIKTTMQHAGKYGITKKMSSSLGELDICNVEPCTAIRTLGNADFPAVCLDHPLDDT